MLVKIYQLPTQIPGTIGVEPNFKFMVTGNSLSDVTSNGFLNQVDLSSNPVSTSDILQVLYNFDPVSQQSAYKAFTVSISNGIILLTPTDINNPFVIYPVTNGHFVNWLGTEGAINDEGYFPSTALGHSMVVQYQNNSNIGHFPVYYDGNGSLTDNNFSPSTTESTTVAMVSPGSNTPANLPQFNDSNGTIGDSGINSAHVLTNVIQNQMQSASSLILDGTTQAATGIPGTVTINRQCGIITTDDLTGQSSYSVTITNSYITSSSIINYWTTSLGTDTTNYTVMTMTSIVDGSADFVIYPSTGNFTGTLVFGFSVTGTNQ